MDLKAQIQALLVVSRWRRIDTDDDDNIDSMAVNISFYRGWLYISMNFLLGEYSNGKVKEVIRWEKTLLIYCNERKKLKQDGGRARWL